MALRVIRRVTESRAFSNLALAAELKRSRLSARDRDLVTELAYGTIRRRIVIDRAIGAASSRPLARIDPEPLAILRLGAYQLGFTRIPAHAAVDETVALAGPRHRGFVNAILRKVAAQPPHPPAGHDDQAVSGRTGLSAWAVAELRLLLPPGEVEEAAEALARPAPLAIRANRCATTADRLAEEIRATGLEVIPGRQHPDVLIVPTAAPAELPGYHQGWFAVQDEASVMVAHAVGAHPGEHLVDVCAGPGGKSSHLACLVGEGGLLVAADARLRRAELARAAAARLGVRVHVVVQDAARPALRDGFDGALVDAPCSGIGASRRRPELLWRPDRRDLASLARLQVAILSGAADLVRLGGRLVYSVCTFPRAETDAVVRAFLGARPDFEPLDLPGPEGPAPVHRLWPHRHGTDAMFYAGFRRSGAPDGPRPVRRARMPGIESAS